MPVKGNDTQHETNEGEGGVELVRRGRHGGAIDRNMGMGAHMSL